MNWIEIALATAPAIAVGLGLVERIVSGRGIGTQFIRLMAVVTVVPIAALLAIMGLISAQVVAGLLGAALGYAFGKMDHKRDA